MDKNNIQCVTSKKAQSLVEGFQFEKNACTVYALSVAANISFEEAHRIASKSGRKKERGFRSAVLLDTVSNLGYKVESVSFPIRRKSEYHVRKSRAKYITWAGIRLYNFVKHFNKGRYFVRMRNHAFAVVDGIPVDPTVHEKTVNPRYKIIQAWKIG